MNDKQAIQKMFKRLEAFRTFAATVQRDGNGLSVSHLAVNILWEERDEAVYQEVKAHMAKSDEQEQNHE